MKKPPSMSFLVWIQASLKRFFMDLRLVSILMTIWLIMVILIMIEIGIFSNSDFVAFGPRKELSFMKVPIDSYYKYNMLIVLIVTHTFITDFIADSLSPHVLNVVQDPKTKYIPHKTRTYIAVTTIWAIYCSITQLFAIFIAFAQLDLLIVRLLSDILANFVTTSIYLHGKEYDPIKFKAIETKQNYLKVHDETNEIDEKQSEEEETVSPPSLQARNNKTNIQRTEYDNTESIMTSPDTIIVYEKRLHDTNQQTHKKKSKTQEIEMQDKEPKDSDSLLQKDHSNC